ncbi:MAG: V-type ATP synthase subunit E family protein [Candidatus Omnitrophota bacterium]
MDIKLESLIERIKQDGVEEAKNASEKIIEDAEKKAQVIINKAQAQAQGIVKSSEEEAERLKNNASAAIKQAGRDMVLAARVGLGQLFDSVFKDSISETLTPDFMEKMLTKIIENWLVEGKEHFEVYASREDGKKLKELIISGLGKKAQERLEVKINSDISGGFRIGLKDKNFYYDFTDQSILEALKSFLTPVISAMLNTNNG